jgi:CRP-like cAMP-binding protein
MPATIRTTVASEHEPLYEPRVEPLSFDMFQWMGPDARAAFSAAAHVIDRPAGTLIYAEGDTGDTMFRIRSGAVRLTVLRDDGRELLFQIYHAGGCFGTSSVVDGGKRPQTAEAYEDFKIEVVDKKQIDILRAAHPDLNDAMLRLLSMNMRLLIDYFAGSNLDGIVAWLAQRLEEAGRAFGEEVDDGVLLTKPLSQSEFAAMVGTSRQTVNKALTELRTRGLIVSRGRYLLIRNLDELKALGERGLGPG